MAEKITLNYITKIEGHADLSIKIDKGKVGKVNLKIFEGARFFENLVKGMGIENVPLVTSRICGVCSQAHLIAASTAIENAYGLKVSEQTMRLRKLLLYSSIMQSHAIHLFLMSLPDYYGLEDSVSLAREKKDVVNLALKIKLLANKVLVVVGGREIHSVTAELGGFKKLPTQQGIDSLREELKADFGPITEAFKRIFPLLEKPEFKTESEFMSLSGDSYASIGGVLKTLSEQEFVVDDYRKYLKERVKKYSTAKFVEMKKKGILTGALARVNLHKDKLNPEAAKLLGMIEKEGMVLPSKSPFNNNLCQAIELIHLYEECIRLLEGFEIRDERAVKPNTGKEVTGISAIEVPRGVLFHEYTIDKDGIVKECNIITPTTQNIQGIENDIRLFLPSVLGKGKEESAKFIERLIRSYDPCISCSTHFLKIQWD